mgnify:CR=1 FL=1|tara:strand:- start:859 stop:1401 length:543 start_codon:yes stop_codon:yes gene_type:complete
MKNIITLTFLLLSVSLFSQDLTYEMVQNQQKKKTRLKDAPIFQSYLSKDNIKYQVGDMIDLGNASNPKNFKTVYLFRSTMNMQVLPSTYQNKKYKIASIASMNNTVMLTLTLGMGGYLKKYSIRTFDFESSLTVKEIKHNGLTSDEALETLKKAKDKLDLGLITKEEYDKIKVELTPLIK